MILGRSFCDTELWRAFLKEMGHGLCLSFFNLFNQNFTMLQQINVKNVHPVSGARIRTHNLLIMSLLP